MAAETFEFELVSPEKLVMAQNVALVVVPGGEGDFGVLRHHAPMISTVRPGVISVYATRSQVSERIFVAGGFAEVMPDRCTVLAEVVVPVGEIDGAATEQQLRDAREDLADAKNESESAQAKKQIEMAEAMLRAIRH